MTSSPSQLLSIGLTAAVLTGGCVVDSGADADTENFDNVEQSVNAGAYATMSGAIAFNNPSRAYDGDPLSASKAAQLKTCNSTLGASVTKGEEWSFGVDPTFDPNIAHTVSVSAWAGIGLQTAGASDTTFALEYTTGGSVWTSIVAAAPADIAASWVLNTAGTYYQPAGAPASASPTSGSSTVTVAIPAGTALANIKIRARFQNVPSSDCRGGSGATIDVAMNVYEVSLQ